MLFLKVTCGGEKAGWAYSPNLRRMISLARLDKTIATGTEVQVRWGSFSDEPACLIRARVKDLPFIQQRRTADLRA